MQAQNNEIKNALQSLIDEEQGGKCYVRCSYVCKAVLKKQCQEQRISSRIQNDKKLSRAVRKELQDNGWELVSPRKSGGLWQYVGGVKE